MNPDDLIGKQGTVQAIVSKGFQPKLDVIVRAYRYRFGTLDLRGTTTRVAEPTVTGWVPEWKVKFED